jgi:hypothetical protein
VYHRAINKGGTDMDISKANFLGSIVSLFILIISCLIFISRLYGQRALEYWLGILFLLTAIPLVYLLLTANQFRRPMLYSIQIVMMMAFLLIELFLDYILKINFRNIKWMTIIYVMFFFGGTGGMIGIASRSGKPWTISAILMFTIMTILAFVQRAITGM